MTAGYSGTPLPKKLGIKPGHRLLVLEAPPGYPAALGTLPDDVVVETAQAEGPYDVILFFVTELSELMARFEPIAAGLTQPGGLWICWPKKAAKMVTNLDGNSVRQIGLDSGLVDNKVCAVDATWSGLRFVIRRENRK